MPKDNTKLKLNKTNLNGLPSFLELLMNGLERRQSLERLHLVLVELGMRP